MGRKSDFLSQSLVYVYHSGEKEKGENLLFKKIPRSCFTSVGSRTGPSNIHAKSYPNHGTSGGERLMAPLPRRVFDLLRYFEKIFLQWKSFDFLHKIWYILWEVALLEICDATKHGRHLRLYLGFYQELEIR